MDQDDRISLGKITVVSSVECIVDIIFNQARSVHTITITIDEPAHMSTEIVYDEGLGYNVEQSIQVGDGGLKPFIDQLHAIVPNCQLIPSEMFDDIVSAQKDVANKVIN